MAKRAKRAKNQESKSFVLRTSIVGGMGVKKLPINWWVMVVPAFLGVHDYPNIDMGVCYPEFLSCSRFYLFILYM